MFLFWRVLFYLLFFFLVLIDNNNYINWISLILWTIIPLLLLLILVAMGNWVECSGRLGIAIRILVKYLNGSDTRGLEIYIAREFFSSNLRSIFNSGFIFQWFEVQLTEVIRIVVDNLDRWFVFL